MPHQLYILLGRADLCKGHQCSWGQLIEAKCDLISVELSSPNEKCHYAVFFRIEISNDTSPEVLMFHFYPSLFILISRILLFSDWVDRNGLEMFLPRSDLISSREIPCDIVKSDSLIPYDRTQVLEY